MNLDKRSVNAYKQQIKSGTTPPPTEGALDIKISNQAIKQQKKEQQIKNKNIMPSVDVSTPKSSSPQSKKSNKNARLFSLNKLDLLLTNQVRKIDKNNYEGKIPHRKCAELLLLLPKTEAAKILNLLSVKEMQAVVKEIVQIQNERYRAKKGGGAKVANGFLKVAFGDEEGDRIFKNATNEENSPFQSLNNATAEQLIKLLKDEPTETLAIVLPRIKPVLAKAILVELNPIIQTDLIKRITQNRKIDASVIFKIEGVLESRLQKIIDIDGSDSLEMDGKKALVDILRHLNSNQEQNIIDNINITMPEIAEDLESNLFNLDTLLMVNDRDLQVVLATISETDLAIIIRGKNTEVRQKILRNISSGRKENVRNEEEALGPLKRSVVDSTTKEFLNLLKEKERNGEISLLRDNFEDEYI